MEQRQAAAAPQSSAGRLRLVFLLARQPLWLAGIAMQAGGLAAHAVALRSGPLAAVQVLMSAELIVAVVIMRIWSGRRLSRGSWAAALTVIAAVAAFLLAVSPGHDHAAGQPHAVAAALGAATTGFAALAAAAAGLHAAGRRRAVLLAVAAGLADSCSAVVTMALSHVASHGLAALATSWAGYALIVCGAGNVLLAQFAYQAGWPMLTLPVIAAVTPLASVAVGAGLLGEAPRTGAAGAATAGLAVLATSLALARLARSVPYPGPEDHGSPIAGHAGPAAPSPARPRQPLVPPPRDGGIPASIARQRRQPCPRSGISSHARHRLDSRARQRRPRRPDHRHRRRRHCRRRPRAHGPGLALAAPLPPRHYRPTEARPVLAPIGLMGQGDHLLSSGTG
jgi:drug/metabolite transporter (DMT)-like permease